VISVIDVNSKHKVFVFVPPVPAARGLNCIGTALKLTILLILTRTHVFSQLLNEDWKTWSLKGCLKNRMKQKAQFH